MDFITDPCRRTATQCSDLTAKRAIVTVINADMAWMRMAEYLFVSLKELGKIPDLGQPGGTVFVLIGAGELAAFAPLCAQLGLHFLPAHIVSPVNTNIKAATYSLGRILPNVEQFLAIDADTECRGDISGIWDLLGSEEMQDLAQAADLKPSLFLAADHNREPDKDEDLAAVHFQTTVPDWLRDKMTCRSGLITNDGVALGTNAAFRAWEEAIRSVYERVGDCIETQVMSNVAAEDAGILRRLPDEFNWQQHAHPWDASKAPNGTRLLHWSNWSKRYLLTRLGFRPQPQQL